MSDTERQITIGQLTVEYSDAARELGTLNEKLRRDGAELAGICERLSSGAFDNAVLLLRVELIERLSLHRLRELLAERADLSRRTAELRERLGKMGIVLD